MEQPVPILYPMGGTILALDLSECSSQRGTGMVL